MKHPNGGIDIPKIPGMMFHISFDPPKEFSPEIEVIKMTKEDMINNPTHYTSGGIDVIDILKAKLAPDQFQGFLLGNITKYMLRADKKGNSLEDLKKAHWYLGRLIDEEEKNEQREKEEENEKLKNHFPFSGKKLFET